MPLILTTGFATQLSGWLAAESVEPATGAGLLDPSGDVSIPGPVGGSHNPAMEIGPAASSALSVGPAGGFTFGAAPVSDRSEPAPIILYFCMATLLFSVHRSCHQLSGGPGVLCLWVWKFDFERTCVVGWLTSPRFGNASSVAAAHALHSAERRFPLHLFKGPQVDEPTE
jgi:hypothetical protein